MAPFTFDSMTSNVVAVAIGFGFGFVLERSGFGNSRNLAAQFYLTDMRVLKVMFTAIVTAMILVFFCSAFGLLDYERLAVPSTYLGPAIVGGLILGVGFIIGGYCPGTSLVSMATLKLDGISFAFGVLFGMFVFGETAPAVWEFFNHAGHFGRLTLPELIGVDAGFAVLGVVVMAVGAFWAAEWAERRFAPNGSIAALPPRARLLRRLAVTAALGLAAVTLLRGQPGIDRRMEWADRSLDERIERREPFLDPAELLDLMHNNQVRLELLDVRSEADFNLFHLLDARRVTFGQLDSDWPATELADKAIVVVMSNDEQAAVQGWKRLAVRPGMNAYILAGGLNRWLDVYQAGGVDAPGPETVSSGDDRFRHDFLLALGARQTGSRPDLKNAPKREYTAKAKILGPVRAASGGCG